MVNLVRKIQDGLRNLVSGLGTSRDKAYHSTHTLNLLSSSQLIEAYRGAWLPRKIVDIPAFDACREWRSWNAEEKEIEAIEAVEKKFAVKAKIKQALTSARLHGGCAILIGDGSSDPSEPLDPSTVKKDGLKYLTVIPRTKINSGDIDQDPSSAYYNQPKYWQIADGDSSMLHVHPSRLVLFKGVELPVEDPMYQTGWGDSVLVSIYNSILQADATIANVASLIFEAKIDVIKIPDMMEHLSDSQYEQKLLDRFTLAATGKGINGTLILDKEEEYDQKNVTFATLPDLMDRFFQNVSGASDIPMTRLFGRSPAGMNATGDSDLINYYDHIASIQEMTISPAISILDEVIIQSAFGSRPKDIHPTWSPLWQQTAKEKADTGKTIVDTAKIIFDMNLYPQEAIADAVSASLTDAGAFIGLEAAVEKYGINDPEDVAEKEMVAVAEAQKMLAMSTPKPNLNKMKDGLLNDATPRTLYVYRKVVNSKQIVKWAKEQGFKEIEDDLHVTVTFSKEKIDWMKITDDWTKANLVIKGGPRLVEALGEASCLLFSNDTLRWRHSDMVRCGASWDFDDYQPHITISYEAGVDLSKVEPYQGDIVLGPEIFEEIKPKYLLSSTKKDFSKDIVDAIKSMPQPTFNIDVKPSDVRIEQAPITVNPPAVTVEPANVTVNVPESVAPPVNVTVLPAQVTAGDVKVDVHIPKPGATETTVEEYDGQRIKRTRTKPIEE